MTAFPHVYTTTTDGSSAQVLKLNCEGIPDTEVAAPPQFGGPAGYWSPEIFFSAAVSSCFILTFKAVARAMKLEWQTITVDADAYLDKESGGMRFTKVDIFVTLRVSTSDLQNEGLKALQKAKESCLITRSLNSEIVLHPMVEVI